jgi:hypothetical protein
MFRVTLTACVEGNPLKAWRGTTGEDDTEHIPDDVWEDQDRPFDTLDDAKAFIRGLHPQTSTHVKLWSDDDLIFDQDADVDHLEDAAPGTIPPHLVDSGFVTDDDVIEAPPLVARQETP